MAIESKVLEVENKSPSCKQRGAFKTILLKEDGSERSFGGITLTNWGLILGCLATLYLFLGLYFGALITLAIEIRQEAWLKPNDDYFGPFEQVNRNLYNAETFNPVESWPSSEDLTIDDPEPIIWKFNRPDGCEKTTIGSIDVLVCDQSGKRADNRWRVNPWIIDLANSGQMNTENGCNLTNQNATILETDGLYTGPNTCINGIITDDVNFIT